jgi:hypothetical protein
MTLWPKADNEAQTRQVPNLGIGFSAQIRQLLNLDWAIRFLIISFSKLAMRFKHFVTIILRDLVSG